MKCPFCQQNLDNLGYYLGGTPKLFCNNCHLFGDNKLFEELSKTKQALDAAVDALKDNLSQANFRQMLDASRFHCIRTKCECALDQIKQITETKE